MTDLRMYGEFWNPRKAGLGAILWVLTFGTMLGALATLLGSRERSTARRIEVRGGLADALRGAAPPHVTASRAAALPSEYANSLDLLRGGPLLESEPGRPSGEQAKVVKAEQERETPSREVSRELGKGRRDIAASGLEALQPLDGLSDSAWRSSVPGGGRTDTAGGMPPRVEGHEANARVLASVARSDKAIGAGYRLPSIENGNRRNIPLAGGKKTVAGTKTADAGASVSGSGLDSINARGGESLEGCGVGCSNNVRPPAVGPGVPVTGGPRLPRGTIPSGSDSPAPTQAPPTTAPSVGLACYAKLCGER